MQKVFRRLYFLLASLLLAVVFTGVVDTATPALAASCGSRCFLGYDNVLQNYGVQAQVTAPSSTKVDPTIGATSFSLLNVQGSYNSGDPYGFIQIGFVWATQGGFCGNTFGVITEYNVSGSGDYHQQYNCSVGIQQGVQYSLAVQYDGNTSNWVYSVNGVPGLYNRVEASSNVGFTGGNVYAFYGETTDSSISMGGPNSAQPVTSSQISPKITSTGGFVSQTVSGPNDYGSTTSASCSITPCPYDKNFNNNGTNFNMGLWTK